MSRHTLVRVLALPLFALLAVVIWSPHAARAAQVFQIDYQPEPLMGIQCNGDSALLKVHVTRVSDGSSVFGATVSIGTESSTTNRGGDARVRIRPASGGHDQQALGFSVTLGDEDTSYSPLAFSCPFSSGPYGLSVHTFVDKDADGVVGKQERDFKHEVTLGFAGSTRLGSLPDRFYHGSFSTTLATSGYGAFPGDRAHWAACLTDAEVAHGWHIVSASGAVWVQSDPCVYLLPLVAGANEVTIGVRRTT